MMMIGQSAREVASSNQPVDYAELIGRCMDSVELAERILGRFEQSFHDDLAGLLDAFQRQDSERIAGIAHRLKGASANVSAGGLTRITSELERLGRSQSFDAMAEWVSALKSEWARFQRRPPLRQAELVAAD